jgi:hypothetical protein
MKPITGVSTPSRQKFGQHLQRALTIVVVVLGSSTTLASASATSVTETDLLTAEVPAYCNMPRQRLVDGKTTKGSPGIGGIQAATFNGTPTITYGDFAKLGYRQALTVYGCTAGGVGWPDVLILVGAKGKLLASFPLDRINNHREHAAVSSVSATGTQATVSWTEYDGAGSDVTDHLSRVSYRKGRLVVATD